MPRRDRIFEDNQPRWRSDTRPQQARASPSARTSPQQSHKQNSSERYSPRPQNQHDSRSRNREQVRSPRNQNDTRPLLNRHGNFRDRAYERDPRHFDNNNTSETGMTSSEHEVEDDVSNSTATVNEFTYHENHLR